MVKKKEKPQEALKAEKPKPAIQSIKSTLDEDGNTTIGLIIRNMDILKLNQLLKDIGNLTEKSEYYEVKEIKYGAGWYVSGPILSGGGFTTVNTDC